ncbi:hypothetical protein B0H10DRAFT_1748348, partial [Mycena sp. CBHHK59/15]
ITNWGRHFQKCSNGACSAFFWHDDPTPVENIPQDIQMRFAMKKSAAEMGTSLMCPEANCLTSAN